MFMHLFFIIFSAYFFQTFIHNVWLGKDIKTAVDEKRIHHQLAPMELEYEEGLEEVNYFITYPIDS